MGSAEEVTAAMEAAAEREKEAVAGVDTEEREVVAAVVVGLRKREEGRVEVVVAVAAGEWWR